MSNVGGSTVTPASLSSLNDATVFMHLVKVSIGSGILFLPHAFSKAGYATALVCVILIGLISCHTAVLIVQCTQILCRRTRRASMSFAEAATTSCKLGPKCIRKYSAGFGVFVNVIVCFVQYQTVIVYALYVATTSQQIIEHHSGINFDTRLYLIMFWPIFCGLALVPDFAYLAPVSVMGTILLGLGIATTFAYFLEDFPDPQELQAFTDIQAVPVFSGIFLFALHNITILIPLENTMRNPGHMKRILISSMAFSTVLYMAFGFLGYNKYRDTCDTVINNLPLDETAARIVKIAVILSVLCTYGLQYYVAVSILWPIVGRNIEKNRKMWEFIFRIFGVTLSTFVAVAVPQMAPLLGLFASVSMTTLMLLIPVAMELVTMWNYEQNRLSFWCRTIKNISIIIVWLLLLVFGVSENLKEIIETYSLHSVKPVC